jgi:outer membrane receptor protein involved in Fe transport
MFSPVDAVPPPPEVEVVVVRPVNLPPPVGAVVFSRLRLEGEDLAGAVRPDGALKQVPGVSLFRRNGSEAANPTTQGLSLRSIAPSGAGRALVTLDGVPLNDPFGGWVIWSAVPTERLATLDVVRGAGAGAWGAGALTGVVSLTELSSESRTFRGDLSAGDHGQARTAFAVSEAGLTLSASAARGPRFTPVRGAARGAADRPVDLESYGGAFRLQRDLGPAAAAVSLSAWREDRESGLAGAASRSEGASGALTLANLEAGSGWRLQAWVRASDLENSSVSVAAGRATSTPASDQYSTPALGWGVNAAWRVNPGAWSLEAGADARLAEGRAHERFRYQSSAFTRGRESGGRTSVAGLYLEGAWVGERVVHSGGVRIDAWSQGQALRRERDLATGAVTLESRAPDTSGVRGSVRFGSRLDLSEGLALRAAAYTGFRPPTLNELHRPFRVGNDVTEANPALRPETLSGADIGLEGESGAWTWSAGAFFNRLSDPVTNVTLATGPGVFPVAGFIPAGGTLRQRRNAGGIDAWGLEAEARGTVGPMDLRAAAAWTDAEVDGAAVAPQLTGLRPAQTARFTATAGATWRPVEPAVLSLSLRHEGDRFDDDLNTRRLKAALALDARAAWSLSPETEIYLAVDNLSDAKVQTALAGDGAVSLSAPRTVRLGFTLRTGSGARRP